MKRSKPERELTDEERNVVISVRHCARELDDILQGARRKAQSNAKLFSETGISIMFRAVESYADMYEKLAIKSRDALERLFSKFSECEEIQDTQDAIEETEGNWRNFLVNLDKEVTREESHNSDIESVSKTSDPNVQCDYLFLPSLPLVDWQTNRETNLQDFVRQYICLVVICQPAYWPDTAVRWRHSEVLKAQCDLSQFKVGYAVVTWGPPEAVRNWCKQVSRITKWPVFWDKSGDFRAKIGFKSGLQRIWAAENLDFLGCQRSMHHRPINPPPTDLNWSQWTQIGGELVLAQPVLWDPTKTMKSQKYTSTSQPGTKRRYTTSDSDDEENKSSEGESHTGSLKSLNQEALQDKEAMNSNQTKVCTLHLSTRISDLMPSGSIYQAALTCYARAHNTTESEVMDVIRRDRRFSTPPESARLQYEATTGLYYDPETALYYDPQRGYFYDSSNQMYYYWSQSEVRYSQLIH
ncbi:unnamed protein product [Heterobilharzia americana]|nr:unnamed protein product [Heterobilharzia americana]